MTTIHIHWLSVLLCLQMGVFFVALMGFIYAVTPVRRKPAYVLGWLLLAFISTMTCLALAGLPQTEPTPITYEGK